MIANKTRSLVKAISWRILASADTFLISYIITGKLSWAGSITLLEIITKTVLYYLHERGWNRVIWGTINRQRTGGESEIRTHDRLASMPVFKTGAFNHSAISPFVNLLLLKNEYARRKSIYINITTQTYVFI